MKIAFIALLCVATFGMSSYIVPNKTPKTQFANGSYTPEARPANSPVYAGVAGTRLRLYYICTPCL